MLYKTNLGNNRFLFLLLLGLCIPLLINTQNRIPYFDGPYIYNEGDSLRIQWVEKGYGFDTLIAKNEATIFQRDSLPIVDLQDLEFERESQSTFNDIDKVVAMSDVHGQYDLMIDLLKAHKVIGADNSWNYGDGHLVIIGDNFDRGEKVLDILWFLFKLQKEAVKDNGKVHVLVGNHELMVLNGDLRYLNKKYYYTSALFTTPYLQFFREGSILGDWVASHNVMTAVNNNLFVHAGISPSTVRLGLSIDTINQIFRENLIRVDERKIFQDTVHELLYLNDGPVWYRGYFDTLETALDSVNYVLNRTEYDKIIIGHTSMDSILPLFNNRILDIDCSIKLGKSGQVLYMDSSGYYTGHMDGSLHPIPPTVKEDKKSIYSLIYELPERPRITIQTDVGRMIGKKSKEEYQHATFALADSSGQTLFELNGRLRARGNVRKKVCRLPPVKFDFSKSDMDSIGLLKLDKLKLLFPCHDRDSDQEMLYKEFLLYELFEMIDSNGIRAKLVDITFLEDDGKEKYDFVGVVVEDEEEYARRKNAIIIESGKIRDSGLDREPFLKMDFFQYMIANTDWSLANKHNLELVKLPDRARVVALPYDFDYSGFVDQKYAMPHESLPISNIHDRYFFSYKISEQEYYWMVEYYLSIEEALYAKIDQATYMKPKTREKCIKYLGTYFKLLRKPEKLKSKMVRD